MARKAIGKKLRFEVFKRDSFKCQYCGESAPDVVLHVDHIKAVKDGGDNAITNLITSCANCNLGKGARGLSDKSAVRKQKKQLEELNERRLQLEMMMEWREGLKQLEDAQLESVCNYYSETVSIVITDRHKVTFRKMLKKFSAQEVLDAIDASTSQYLQPDGKGWYTQDSLNKTFDYVGRIATVNRRGGYDDNKKRLYYIRGILKNRIHWFKSAEWQSIKLMESAINIGVEAQELEELAKKVRNWTEFKQAIEAALDDEGVSYA